MLSWASFRTEMARLYLAIYFRHSFLWRSSADVIALCFTSQDNTWVRSRWTRSTWSFSRFRLFSTASLQRCRTLPLLELRLYDLIGFKPPPNSPLIHSKILPHLPAGSYRGKQEHLTNWIAPWHKEERKKASKRERQKEIIFQRGITMHLMVSTFLQVIPKSSASARLGNTGRCCFTKHSHEKWKLVNSRGCSNFPQTHASGYFEVKGLTLLWGTCFQDLLAALLCPRCLRAFRPAALSVLQPTWGEMIWPVF